MAERTVVVIQARLGSTRLPGKTLADIAGRPLLAHVVERAAAIPGIADVVLATTANPADDELEAFARAGSLRWVRGSEQDVLDRFCLAAREAQAEVVVRVTADCPLLDPAVSGRVLAEYVARRPGVDYVSNVHPPTYPDGLDTEVFSVEALEVAAREAHRPSEREHVTPYLWGHPERFRLSNVEYDQNLSEHRWTVDTPADLEFVREVLGALGPSVARAGMGEVLRLLEERPGLRGINAGTSRNEGFERSLAAERRPITDIQRGTPS
jgi:spore coat polysaccharide biosynthesis protein SpsF (cytidylyltransferase family)